MNLIDGDKLLEWLEKEWVHLPFGAVADKVRMIYNEVKSGSFAIKEDTNGLYKCPKCGDKIEVYDALDQEEDTP